MAKNPSILRIRQVRSRIGQTRKQREGLQSLGLRRIGQVVERPDNPAVRGTVRAIAHLVSVEGEGPVLAKLAPATTAEAVEAKASAAEVAAPRVAVATDTKPKADVAAQEDGAAKVTKKKAVKKKTTKKKATKKKTAAAKTTKKKAKTVKKKKKAGGGKA